MYAADRQLFLLLIVLALFAGCGDEYASIPASTSERTPFEYEGSLGRIWGGDNFEVIHEGSLHYAFVRGIDTPEPGQAFYEEAKEMLAEICKERIVVVSVLRRDDWKREVCDVVIKDPAGAEEPREFDIALELVEKGLAWHDLNDEPWADRYRAAELLARSQKIGIWSQANPVPPWEYWKQQLQQARGASGQ